MPVQQLRAEEAFVLDAAFGRVEAARRAVDQARRELGAVMRSVGLSASARHLKRSRQWALQVAQESEEPRRGLEEGSPLGDDLSDSIRRLGIMEPILVEVVDDDFLKVLDGHRRLRTAREAGLTSLPVSLQLQPRSTGPAPLPKRSEPLPAQHASESAVAKGHTAIASPNVTTAEEAVRGHCRMRFLYRGLEGESRLRTVDAWGLVWRSGLAYLVGYDQERAAIRTFRLDRVQGEIKNVGEGTPAPEGFSAERNVWSQLDPAIAEAMQAMFRKVYREMARGRALEDWLDLAQDSEPEFEQ